MKDTNLKAEAIDQLAREQAVAQARKMVQSATDETREIQNAHRLRLQDLKSRISEMEKTRGEMMDYLAKMIEELQKTQEYASQNAPLVPHKESWPRRMPNRGWICRPTRSMQRHLRCAAARKPPRRSRPPRTRTAL